ncbi:MAG: SDR family oxidoreductase [Nanoarchaeota archaeon]
MSKILITGSSGGLGKELAIEFARRGNKVIAHGRNRQNLKRFSGDYVVGDITEGGTLRELVRRAEGLNILVNNVGTHFDRQASKMSMDELRKLMEVNFFSHVDLTLRVLPIFLEKREGLIVNINSVAGKAGSVGKSAYASSKHALSGFFDSLKYEVTEQGVRILNIYLGGMKTPMSRHRKEYEDLMDPKEVAKVIVDNCEARGSLYVPELHIGRVRYGNH